MAATRTVGPTGNWCGVINSSVPGDTVVLQAGTYTSTCTISVSGTASAPITIRSASSATSDRAVMAYSGTSDNLFNLDQAAYITIRWITFQNTQTDIDAIKIKNGHDFVIDSNLFQGIGGISIGSNTTSTQNISVTNNTFKNLNATAMYFGCQDGSSCRCTNILVQSNLISGVVSPDVGYGLEIKLNSYGTVRDNTIYSTQGPGIMVYGSNIGNPPSLIEGNYVEGSTTDTGINVGGGPAIVRNNVLVGNHHAGIYAQNYDSYGLQQNVWIVNNTLLNNSYAGIITESWTPNAGDVLAYNAIAPASGTVAVYPSLPNATVAGNVTCSPATSCFDQPTTAPYDLWPKIGGPLVGAAGSGSEPWRVTDDFMGVPRGSAADVGAFQRNNSGSGPLVGGGGPRPARTGGDSTPPSITLTAPLNGGTVSGTVTVSANASDNVGVTSVQFYVDGAALGSALSAAPYSISWNTTAVANGSHTLTAAAWDAAGNRGASNSVTVTVSDTKPDFSLSANSASLTIAPGASGTTSVSTSVIGGFNSAISLVASGLPSGVSATFNPASIAAPGNGTSTLTLTVSSSAVAGSYSITITGSGGGTSHTASVSLTISSSGGGGSGFAAGFDFRATSGFVADGASTTYVLGNPYPTTRGGLTFGWTGGVDVRDRSASGDPRLAGINFVSDATAAAVFTVNLPAAGTYDISLAMGDAVFSQCPNGCKIEFRDGSTSLFTISKAGVNGGYFYDANGALWSAASWPAGNTSRRVTMAGNKLTVLVGAATGKSDVTPIAYLLVKQAP